MSVFSDVEKAYNRYKGCKEIIGRTGQNRPIYAFKVGHGCPVGIVQAGIHAREWITAYLVLEQILFGLAQGTAYFIPLSNPDGAVLATEGLSKAVCGEYQKRLLLSANGSDGTDFSLWKANASAVDLNVNFDACWGKGLYNVKFPASQNYIGTSPCSENETKALVAFTKKTCPNYTISYHTQGEEIYWQFHQPLLRCTRDKKYACILSCLTGYPLKSTKNSSGGYKDWCIQKLKIPAFTIEVGSGKHPIGFDQLDGIIGKNLSSVSEFSKRFYG